ncbi:MAG TPA: septal ring lytic transglycosylase RlpA family protein [Stellaceae bacterium]|nr:septal ring lytic transglycosylase RlpA family protein [Stellaceae bacterium]
MRYGRFLLLLATMGGLAAPAAGEEVASTEPFRVEQPVFSQTGIATCYGGRAVGHETASGERLARHGLTAAHRSLPFGTIVRVTNLGNGQVAKVRINDRGPNVRRKMSRIIDLSMDAATALGITRCGIARIKIEELISDQHGA